MGMFWTCEETAAALSDYLDGVLPLGLFLKTRAHLFNCPGCRALLATLRALPALAAGAREPEEAFGPLARQALEGALARLARGEAPRAWAAAPVPPEARRMLEACPDFAIRLLASTHEQMARAGAPPSGPYPLPRDTLDRLPPPETWHWLEAEAGIRKAELFAEPQGSVRLFLVHAPPNSILLPHRHLGSESILVLDGGLDDRGREYGPGEWLHYVDGSCHAPRIPASGCWCLTREEGRVRFMGPADWLRHLRHAS